MRRVLSHRDAIAAIAGLVLPVVVAAVIVPFRGSFASTASALILVAVVVGVASNGNRGAGFIAAVSASLWFDFFLLKPYERFAITQRADIETAVSLFVVGIAVTELAAAESTTPQRRERRVGLRRSHLPSLRDGGGRCACRASPRTGERRTHEFALSSELSLRRSALVDAPSGADRT